MKGACDRCGAPIEAHDIDVFICSYECTWCRGCVEAELGEKCPNCGGQLRLRPPRTRTMTSTSSNDAAAG